jgi:DNA-binding HxlR family transcriptional regulator
MIQYEGKRYTCALDFGFEKIRGKWKAVILCHLADGPRRFLALQRTLGGISQKVLNESLREMEEDGLIHKEVFPETPPRVEYSLARKGAELVPALKSIESWTVHYYGDVLQPSEGSPQDPDPQ